MELTLKYHTDSCTTWTTQLVMLWHFAYHHILLDWIIFCGHTLVQYNVFFVHIAYYMYCYLGLSRHVCGTGFHALKLNGTKFVSEHFMYHNKCQGHLLNTVLRTPVFVWDPTFIWILALIPGIYYILYFGVWINFLLCITGISQHLYLLGWSAKETPDHLCQH